MATLRRLSSWGWLVLVVGVMLAGFVATGGGVGGTGSDDGSQLWVPASGNATGLDSVVRVNGVSGVLESGRVDAAGCRLYVGESGTGVVLTDDGPVSLDGVSLTSEPIEGAPEGDWCDEGSEVFIGDGVGWVVSSDGVVRFDLDGLWIDEDWFPIGSGSVSMAADGLALLLASRDGLTRLDGTAQDQKPEPTECGDPFGGAIPEWGRAGDVVVAVDPGGVVWRLDGGCGVERAGRFDPSVDVRKVGGVVRSPVEPMVVGLAQTSKGRGLGWVDVDSGASGVVDLGRVRGCLTVPVVSESRAWVVAPALDGGTAFGVNLASPGGPEVDVIRRGLGMTTEGCGSGPGDVFVAAGPGGGVVVTSGQAESVWTFRSGGRGWFEAEKRFGSAEGEDPSSSTTVVSEPGQGDDPLADDEGPVVVLPEAIVPNPASGPTPGGPPSGTPPGVTPPPGVPPTTESEGTTASTTTTVPQATSTTTTTGPPSSTMTVTVPTTSTTVPVSAARWEACRPEYQAQIPPEECDYVVDVIRANPDDSPFEPPVGTFDPCSDDPDFFTVGCEGGHVVSLDDLRLGRSTYPEGISVLSMLRNLSMAEGPTLPSDFGQLSRLETLYNDEFQVTYNGDGSGLVALTRIEFEFGSAHDGTFDWIGDVPNLRLLALAGDVFDSGLSYLPVSFTRLSRLESLDLGPGWAGYPNRFSSVPVEIRSMASLRRLDMSGNPVDEIPPWIGELRQLDELVLSDRDTNGNPVYPSTLDGKVIPDGIRQTSLTSLDLGTQCMTGELPVTETWLDANAPNWDDGCP